MMAIFVATLMILSALVIALPGTQGREYGMSPAATSSANIQPNPTLNTNVSWSTFHNGWHPLEYTNGSANLTLNADMSSIYANPITVLPQNIVANGSMQNDKIGSIPWNDYTPKFGSTTATGQIATASNYTLAPGIEIPQLTENGSEAGGSSLYLYTHLGAYGLSVLPSTNPAYDYITVGADLSGSNMAGMSASIGIYNGSSTFSVASMLPNQASFISINLASLDKEFHYGFNLTGKGAMSGIEIILTLNTPAAPSTDTWTGQIFAEVLTTSQQSLGTNATGAQQFNVTGNAHLTSFAPTFSWSSVVNNGYTVAVSQPFQNLTMQQSAINSGSYTEQVEYQGQFELPTAPDLSYGPANVTEHFNVSTSQTQVLDINGVSYLSTISGKNNTVLLLPSVNPNGQTQFLQIVDYTQSQWTSISSPPGIFTLAGIEYYWEEFIIAVLAIVGVGAGAASRHASNLRKVK